MRDGGSGKTSKVRARRSLSLSSLQFSEPTELSHPTFFFLLPMLLFCSWCRGFLQLSWSKSLVRKWFNIRGKSHDFHADGSAAAAGRPGE